MSLVSQFLEKNTKKIIVPGLEEFGEITIRKLTGRDYFGMDLLPTTMPLPEDVQSADKHLPDYVIAKQEKEAQERGFRFFEMVLTKCIVDAPFKIVIKPYAEADAANNELSIEALTDENILHIVNAVKEFSSLETSKSGKTV